MTEGVIFAFFVQSEGGECRMREIRFQESEQRKVGRRPRRSLPSNTGAERAARGGRGDQGVFVVACGG